MVTKARTRPLSCGHQQPSSTPRPPHLLQVPLGHQAVYAARDAKQVVEAPQKTADLQGREGGREEGGRDEFCRRLGKRGAGRKGGRDEAHRPEVKSTRVPGWQVCVAGVMHGRKQAGMRRCCCRNLM